MANLYKTNGDIDRALSPHLLKGTSQRKTSPLQQQSAKNGCSASMGDAELCTSKPNQVGTVLLYGVPIVSLHIESQERLCLAQISNTLLKQFSYNEIHNRRVALGITCVQCTPVQLEILRRAGAMPVSSRRCGMITRREAERLCKSFLGDNAPPRLPDDFAFSVYHECAWGCRGQFLPSRYNSSRAKCIKCSYCGLFFSPNKFIFHSHRLGPSDKYIQPDAANFNSWRRHMKLSGVSPDEIVHAWEDVKAMFNGGTRKRLMGSVPSSSASISLSNPNRTSLQSHQRQSPKRSKEASVTTSSMSALRPSISPSIIRANTSASTTQQYPVRSFNVHSSKVNGDCPRLVNTPTFCGNVIRTPTPNATDLPVSVQFSRSLMMDYMWHSQQQQQQHQQQQPSAKHDFQFPAYALPWLKHQPSAHMLFGHQTYNANSVTNKTVSAAAAVAVLEDDTIGRKGALGLARTEHDQHSSNPLTYYKNSAFKPVHMSHRQYTAATAAVMTSRELIGIASPSISERIDESLSANNISEDEISTHGRNKRKIRRSYGKQSRCSKSNGIVANTTVEESSSDEEILDIETTEDQNLIESGMVHCMNDSIPNGDSVANIDNERVVDGEIANDRELSERSDYETSTKTILPQCNRSESRNISANTTATADVDCVNHNNNNNNNDNTINNNKKIKVVNNNNNNNNINVKSASEMVECEENAIDVIATDTLSMHSSDDDDDGDDDDNDDGNSDVDVVVDTQKWNTTSKLLTTINNVKRGDSLSPSISVPTSTVGHVHTAEHDETSAMVNLKKEVLHNNSNYPLSSLDSGIMRTKTASFLDLSKDDDRDMTDLSDMKANAGTVATVAATDMSFPTFVPDIKLPPFPVPMSAMDTALSTQPSDNDFRGSAIPRYTFDRKCVRSPSPTSRNVFCGNVDLLANRIGQFYPVPHVFQHHQHHHLSKHFHHMLNQHNFLQTNATSNMDRTGGADASGTLNLSTNQYHQSQAHLLHQQHSRPN